MRIKVEAVSKTGRVSNLSSRFPYRSEKDAVRDAQDLSFQRFTYAHKDETVIVSRGERVIAVFRRGKPV